VKCVSSGGYVVLYYRGQPSSYIYAKDGAEAVTSALEVGTGEVGGSFATHCVVFW
jgi:hypothetical protein